MVHIANNEVDVLTKILNEVNTCSVKIDNMIRWAKVNPYTYESNI